MFFFPGPVFGLISTWLTPLWLLSVGVALGMAVLGVAYGLVFVVSRRAAEVIYSTVREGVLLPIFDLGAAMAAFAVLGIFLVPGIPYRNLLAAVQRIGAVGPTQIEFTVPPASHDVALPLNVSLSELQYFRIESDQPASVTTNVMSTLGQALGVRMVPGSPAEWSRPIVSEKEKIKLPSGETTRWTASNPGGAPAKLKILAITDIEYPEVRIVPLTAISVMGLFSFYLAVRALFPKIAAVAQTTARESMAQPLFFVVLALGGFALVSFIFIPYNTFGEDVKVLKDSGLTMIMVLSMIVAVWSASVSVSEEVEGRTALTVLSKPVKRRQFILGKFLGVLGPVVVLFAVLGLVFLLTVSYKVVYDARETARQEPAWQLCNLEMVRIIPGMVLAFLETVVLAAISVAISTRVSTLANLMICASIYVLGHLVPMLVNSSVGKFEIVRFVGQFIATILPVMDHFNIQAAVAAGATVPVAYLGLALVYCLVYSAIAMLLGLALFEDRDLA